MRSTSIDSPSPPRAYELALRLLAGRDCSVSQLRGKLLTRGISAAEADQALERLQAEGWLDDRRFAEQFIESALQSSRYTGPRLKMELRRRGVSPELAASLLEPRLDGRDEPAEVAAVLEKRFPGFRWQVSDEREKRRIMSFLQRRGFGMTAVLQAMRGFGE